MKRFVLLYLILLSSLNGNAQTRFVSTAFGIKSDGRTDNTSSIQFAINHISNNGGGTLSFFVGRYLTGPLELKENVIIELCGSAVLVASPNIYYYRNMPAFLNCGGKAYIKGSGVIEFRKDLLLNNLKEQQTKGFLSSSTSLPKLTDGVNIGERVIVIEKTAASLKY